MCAAVERAGNPQTAGLASGDENSARQAGMNSPTVQKYGTVLLEEGFTQHTRVVEDYLRTLGLCSTEILLVQVLESYRWQADREIYPSIKVLAMRCGVKARRVSQMTAHLVESGLLVKIERFASRSRTTNYYDLEPLYRKAAAWRDREIALELAEQEGKTSEPFQPRDVLEEVAQIISEEFGEPEPGRIRYNVQRLERRWSQHPHLEWRPFLGLIEKAVHETEARKKERTQTGQTFNQLVQYFFSALDHLLARARSVRGARVYAELEAPGEWEADDDIASEQFQPPQAPASSHLSVPVVAHQQASSPPPSTPEVQATRTGGKAKVRATETIALHMSAISLTFNDEHPKSSLSQAANLWNKSGLDEKTLLQLMVEARADASRHSVKARTAQGRINRMPYFFAALRRRVEEYCRSSKSPV